MFKNQRHKYAAFSKHQVGSKPVTVLLILLSELPNNILAEIQFAKKIATTADGLDVV